MTSPKKLKTLPNQGHANTTPYPLRKPQKTISKTIVPPPATDTSRRLPLICKTVTSRPFRKQNTRVTSEGWPPNRVRVVHKFQASVAMSLLSRGCRR
ncbi:hypothetical protein CEXT_138441 [Caerostris extrusa]|uniref:Uncharacterized protein n=1 Tax=Caerostris extrusa TaxID=172846 RepID=A0AAV4VQS9_CAEEX|nr:hypothetical protein CEXT_138441 [Caerostris extrusa]